MGEVLKMAEPKYVPVSPVKNWHTNKCGRAKWKVQKKNAEGLNQESHMKSHGM